MTVESPIHSESKSSFQHSQGTVKAVDGVDLHVKPGETVVVLGESGSGKTVTALSITRLVPILPGRIVSGEIYFQGKDVLKMKREDVRRLRGRQIAMIFQEPMSSLYPAFTVGQQIMEVLSLHQGLKGRDALDKAIEMLKLVKIPSP